MIMKGIKLTNKFSVGFKHIRSHLCVEFIAYSHLVHLISQGSGGRIVDTLNRVRRIGRNLCHSWGQAAGGPNAVIVIKTVIV